MSDACVAGQGAYTCVVTVSDVLLLTVAAVAAVWFLLFTGFVLGRRTADTTRADRETPGESYEEMREEIEDLLDEPEFNHDEQDGETA